MKLWAFLGIVCVNSEEEPKTCDLNELSLPEHAVGWICSENETYSNNLILKSGKCSVDCEDGYIATADSRRVEHKCNRNGWANPNNVILRCALDLENAYEKMAEELEMVRNEFQHFDEEIAKRDALIDEFSDDSNQLELELESLNEQ